MEMTAPVISTASQSGIETMQFVMEREYGEKGENLPNPRDARSVPLMPQPAVQLHDVGFTPFLGKLASISLCCQVMVQSFAWRTCV